MGRLADLSRGRFVSSENNGTTLDSITSTPKATNAWALDALGNPTTGGNNHTFNTQDQITSITGKTTPVYDYNGNMTRDEAGHTYIYDAWNRMVSAYNGTNAETIIYDADNRRPGLNICGTTVTDSYYTTSWQDIEDDVVTLGCGGSTTKSTYVWSESYIDDVVARDQSVNSGPIARVYAEQDANHDTTSLVNASGTALERFIYDPYGTRTVLNPGSWSTTGDSQSWLFGFQGGRLDPTSGKINFRNRDLDPVTDTWMEKDPIGYFAGPDPYQYDNSSPVDYVDPMGTDSFILWKGHRRDFQNHLHAVYFIRLVHTNWMRQECGDQLVTVHDVDVDIAYGGEAEADRLNSGLQNSFNNVLAGNGTAAALEFALHSVPAGGAADYVGQGKYAKAAGSAGVDAALTALTFGIGKGLKALGGAMAARGGAEAGLNIAGREFMPSAGAVMQNLVDQEAEKLAANPALARRVLYRAEYKAGQCSAGVAKMHYGNAVERMVAKQIKEDADLSVMFKHWGGPNQADFAAIGPWQGPVFDVSTAGGAAAKGGRWYGQMIDSVVYQRPPTFTVFP